MNPTSRLLLVEDDDAQRALINDILRNEHYQVQAVASVEEAILALKQHPFDAVFSDWKLGSLSGLDLLRYVRKNQPDLGFAIATAYGTIAHAVEAINEGADDYLAKPFQRQELLLCVDKILKARKLRSQNQELQQALSEQNTLVDLVGNAPCMQRVYDRIKRVSNTKVTVLISGESGTGKELAARALQQLSERKTQSFIAVNCGAIPENLAEAELFGAIKGAYTGADQDKTGKIQAAHNGTLFLDEIGELPLSLQARLLRFLQEGTVTPLGSHEEIKVDVRVIAATHRNLEEMVQQGSFREDLWYRLNILPITIPPLRERKEDIARLINHFAQKFSQHYQVQTPQISRETLKILMDYHWPGNVRELSNRLERFCLLADEAELVSALANSPEQVALSGGFKLPEEGINWEALESSCLQQALDRCGGNRTQAAKLLGLNYKAFIYRLDKFGLGK